MQIFRADMAQSVAARLRALWTGAPAIENNGVTPMHVLATYRELRRSGSNLELDWLWLATQLSDPSDRRYCLERALAINPQSTVARDELARVALRIAQPCENCPA
jgi:hypothetical protein